MLYLVSTPLRTLLHDLGFAQKQTAGSESEEEDWCYKPDDVILVATKSKDDMGTLEVWVYEQADDVSGGNLFVHHDLVLPSFPLCLALMDFQPDGGSKVTALS